MNALEDVRETKRLNLNDEDPKHTPATCYSCKAATTPVCGRTWAWQPSTP